MADEYMPQVVVISVALIAIVVCYLITKYLNQDNCEDSPSKECSEIQEDEQKDKVQESNKIRSSKKEKILSDKKKEVKDLYTHNWLLSNLKGHSGKILDMDFSPNGKYLASCADDRSVLLWMTKTFTEKNHKSIRTNIEYDYATRVRWSPDIKAFMVSVGNENALQVYKVGKKKDGTIGNTEIILRFPVKHNSDIINIGIACNGLFIMSCSSDTNMVIWDLKGEVLGTIDTLHINNYYACVSPCGRFVASSGFTPDVRVWEVIFNKLGEFKEIKRAFELKGHTSGVYHFSFSNDSSRMVTVSKDGTWKLWNTDIEYSKGQEPYLIRTHDFETSKNSCIALSSDGRTIAVCAQSSIWIYSALNGDKEATLSNIHSEPIQCLSFSSDGQFLLAAAGRFIRIFKNICGYENIITDLEESKKHATNQSIKRRLENQIDDAQSALNSLLNTTVK